MPAHLSQMLRSPDELHVAIKISNEKSVRGEQASERKKENKSNVTNPKVIMLIEAKIQPQRRAELIEAARRPTPLVRAEPRASKRFT